MTVNRYLQLLDSDSGPSMWIWIWSKHLWVGWKVWKGARTCFWTLDRWQLRQDLAHWVTCLFRPCHTNLAETSRFVSLAPGWAKAWIVSNTLRLHISSTTGLAEPVKMSHNTVKAPSANGTSASLSFVMAVQYACTSGSSFWAFAYSR